MLLLSLPVGGIREEIYFCISQLHCPLLKGATGWIGIDLIQMVSGLISINSVVIFLTIA